MSHPKNLQQLRRFATTRSISKPTRLMRAIEHQGFVEADPMGATARAQGLILAHRVTDYHAGELERRYQLLAIAMAVFTNYGFLPREGNNILDRLRLLRCWDV